MKHHLKNAKVCIDCIDNATMEETDIREFLYGITHALIATAEIEKEKSITLGALNVNLAAIADQLEKTNKPCILKYQDNDGEWHTLEKA